LSKLYREQADLIVPVLCPEYDRKRWAGWEWVYIHDLLTEADRVRVMPSRFGYATVDGLSLAAGFIELDDKTPEQFATIILERLALNQGNPKNHYTRPAPTIAFTPATSIPHNLPLLQPFFGRVEELKTIAEALDPENHTWGRVISGPAGMGKTSLAVRAAYDASPDAFDRIAFVSLKTRELDDDGVRDLSGFLISGLAEVFNELSSELGHAEIAKAGDVKQRGHLLCDALRGTRTLLILDNLEGLIKDDRDFVFTFVKKLPTGCKAILTSRRRIGSAAEELVVGKLDEAAALATLAKLAEGNPALAATSEAERLDLYRETGGKSLLLRWTAGQIGRGSCVTLTDAIRFLHESVRSVKLTPFLL
jgi:NB-ARC domain